MTVKVKTRKKTTREAHLSDYRIDMGIEIETGISNVRVARASSWFDPDGNVYSHTTDGGGVELRTVVFSDPTMFDIISRLDVLYKSIRRSEEFHPYQGAGTHVHFTVNAATSEGKIGESLRRRVTIEENIYMLFLKYIVALRFFDGFHPGGVRNSDYGLPFLFNRNGDGSRRVKFRDSRYHDESADLSHVCSSHGRESLLRTGTNYNLRSHIHFEYRGMDGCSSAIFMGLKIELLKAICKKAIWLALQEPRVQLISFYNFSKLDAMIQSLASAPTILDVMEVRARVSAAKMVNDLAPFLPTYAIKGLSAWLKAMSFLDHSVGTSQWYDSMEAYLIAKTGIHNFLTKENLLGALRTPHGTALVTAKECQQNKLPIERKFHTYLARSSWGRGTPQIWYTGRCSNCGMNIDTRGMPYAAITICPSCIDSDTKAGLVDPKTKEYYPRIKLLPIIKSKTYRKALEFVQQEFSLPEESILDITLPSVDVV